MALEVRLEPKRLSYRERAGIGALAALAAGDSFVENTRFIRRQFDLDLVVANDPIDHRFRPLGAGAVEGGGTILPFLLSHSAGKRLHHLEHVKFKLSATNSIASTMWAMRQSQAQQSETL